MLTTSKLTEKSRIVDLSDETDTIDQPGVVDLLLESSLKLFKLARCQAIKADGEILEINQVCSYFAYANRTVLGLGVITKGDILGLSPNESDDPDNWSHS